MWLTVIWKYRSIVLIIAILILAIVIAGLMDKLKTKNSEISKLQYNQSALMKGIDSSKKVNGNTLYSTGGLELTLSELKENNKKLVDDIKQLGIKVKNLNQVTNVSYSYNYFKDTINSKKLNDTTFIVNVKDTFLNFSQKVMLLDNKSKVVIDSFNLTLIDSLQMPYEIMYKRSWIFWKKPIGIKMYAIGKNPYLHINRMETIYLRK